MNIIKRVTMRSLFGPISELELITFFFIIFFSILEYQESFFMFFKELLLNAKDISNQAFIVYAFLCTLIFTWITSIFVFTVYNALDNREMSLNEKKILIYSYYLFFPIVILISLFEIIGASELSKIESIVITFLAVKAVVQIFFHYALSRLKKYQLIIDKMTSRQITKIELFVIIGLSIIFYNIISASPGAFTKISLTYFYTIIIISAFINIFEVSRPIWNKYNNIGIIKGP